MPHNGKIEIGAERAKKLKAIVQKRGKKWSVLVAQVDPDGIATAFAVQAALEELDVECGIYYSGGFGHPQNRILYNVFELMKHMKPVKDLPGDTVLALADSSRFADSRFRDAEGRKMVLPAERFGLIVDHHMEDVQETADFLPIIITCGAAATLGWKLLCAVGGKADERLCQLTAIGIMSDTDRLTHPITKGADREVFNKAMETASQQFIHDCFDYALPDRYLDLYQEVLTTKTTVCDDVRIAHVTSLLMEDEGDYLSIMADSLRKVKGAETTVVWGVAGKEVRASVRTRSKETDLTKLIEAIFGAGNGGSKYGSGGARYTLADPHVPFAHTSDLLIKYLSAQYQERVSLFLGSNEKKRRAKTDKTAP
jgi:nanoRNase/pAp phosphatase (c-di-AMP/oligoRNAs hydrolase)